MRLLSERCPICLDEGKNKIISMIKSRSIFNFFGPAVWVIQDGKESSPIRCLFS